MRSVGLLVLADTPKPELLRFARYAEGEGLGNQIENGLRAIPSTYTRVEDVTPLVVVLEDDAVVVAGRFGLVKALLILAKAMISERDSSPCGTTSMVTFNILRA